MNRTTRLALLATLAGATTAPACLSIAPVDAQTIPRCGGQAAMQQVPAGSRAMCLNDRLLLDGQIWSNTVIVSADGTVQVNWNVPTPLTVDVPLEVEVHFGASGAGGNTFLGVMPAGDSSTQMFGQVDLTQYAAFGCVTQIDAKAYNGNKDHEVTNRVRVSGGFFQWTNCSTPATTTTTTPTTVPVTTVPDTSSPTTNPPPDSTPTGSGVSTTNLPPSSVVGGTIPATGPTPYGFIIIVAGLTLLVGGLALVVRADKRAES